MKLGTFNKQPRERTPYTINYGDSLSSGDYIPANGTQITLPAGCDLVVDQITVLTPRLRFFVSKGTSGMTYKIQVLTTSADGVTFEDEVIIKVKEL